MDFFKIINESTFQKLIVSLVVQATSGNVLKSVFNIWRFPLLRRI